MFCSTLSIFSWHYRCVDILSSIPTEYDSNEPVYLARLGINSPAQLKLYIDAVSFRVADDDLIRHLEDDEEFTQAGTIAQERFHTITIHT